MNLSEVKQILPTLENVVFQLEDNTFVPENFHVTEVGIITKHFIDCGGKTRDEKVVNFQLWNANDFDHLLKPTKLLHIIQLSQEKLNIGDLKVEVEYQSSTIGKYDLEFNGKHFLLKNKHTACLAQDTCGIPSSSATPNMNLTEFQTSNSVCKPNSGCCS